MRARRPAAGRARRGDARRVLGDRLASSRIGRPAAVHRRRAARGRRDPARPSQGRTCRPTAMFDERRFFAAGRRRARDAIALWAWASASRVCEDFWHLPGPAAARARRRADPDQHLVVARARRRREERGRPGTATSWRTLMRTYAQLTTSFVVFVNRVGVDESMTFWGGSEVIGPSGEPSSRRRSSTRRCTSSTSTSTTCGASGSRLPLLRDERPELQCAASSDRIIAERAGLASDSTAEPGAEPGLDVAPGRSERRSGARACRGARGADPAPVAPPMSAIEAIPLDDAGRPLFELPDELRDRHRRRAPGHRRLHPRPARARPASSGCVLGLSGGIDSALVAYLVGRGDRRRQPAVRADAVPDVVARLAGRRGGVVAALGCPSELVDITPMVDGYFGRMARSAPAARASATRRPCDAATSWPGCA